MPKQYSRKDGISSEAVMKSAGWWNQGKAEEK